MTKREHTIGLEIHAILKTRTKMFCDSLNDPDEKHPNVNVCPVCLGHPGTLPTINKQAVESVLKVGLALGGKVNAVSKFDRKNYFYPDLPKGYQISQYDKPLVLGGELLGVRLRRIHLEEDAGRLLHVINEAHQIGDNRNVKTNKDTGEVTGIKFSEPVSYSLVDFNRAGAPLMELVTEPDIRSAEQAVAFGKELQLILQYLGVSDADMEKGLMRIEANVSLDMGPKVELKNINSFKAVGAAIAYELKRQEEIIGKGEAVEQETRGWDDAGQRTVSQRSKEEAHDYRYFPEPDLPPFEPPKIFDLEDLARHLPELPAQKRARFQKELRLSEAQAIQLVESKPLADFFEAAASELATRDEHTASILKKAPQDLLFSYLTSDLTGLMNEAGIGWGGLSAGGGSALGGKVNPEELAHLVDLIADGKIGSRQAKDILKKMFETGEDPETVMREENLETVSDSGALAAAVEAMIAAHPEAVADYRKGKAQSIQFLIGKAMGHLRGRGNPDALMKLFLEKLAEDRRR